MKRPFDSDIGTSPRTPKRTRMSAGVARYAAMAIGRRLVGSGAASRAASVIQRAYRGYRQAGRIAAYARGLRRIYNSYGGARAWKMGIGNGRAGTPYSGFNYKSGKALPKQVFTKGQKLTRMSGKFGGSFKKPRKLSKKVNPYVTKGFESTTEIIGTVADPDCVYMGASALSTMTAIECVAQALLRSLFEKCIGIPITNLRTPLQGYYNAAFPFNNADGFRLQLTWMQVNIVGGENQVTYETGTADSIYSICGQQSQGVTATWPQFIGKLREWAHRAAPSDANTQIPLRLNIYRRDGNVSNFYMGSGGIDLRNVRVHYATSVAIKLQNRSLSAAGSSSTDTVDANPLQGYLYEFKGGVPMFKNLDQASGTLRLNRMFDASAVMLARAGEIAPTLGPGTVNKEPPNPRFWANCIKASKVKLEPGEVKKHFFTWSTSDRLINFLRKVNVETDAGVIVQTVNTPGKCCLFALEDMINVNALNNIAVTYEVNRVDKCYITSTPYKVAQGTFSSITLNDLP